ESLNIDYPWIKKHNNIHLIEFPDWLSSEIRDFVNYVSPTKDEIIKRNTCFNKVRNLIASNIPNSHVHVFGSFAADLYLPDSDIDMVVICDDTISYPDTKSLLFKVASLLRNEKITSFMETITKTAVPIIRIKEKFSNLKIDISFNQKTGLKAAGLIRSWLNEFNGLRELILVIKQFIKSRKLNDVHFGGIGGFAIICLAYTFFKIHPRIITNSINPEANLGTLLIEFFELYGKNFNYNDIAILISAVSGPSLAPKYIYQELSISKKFDRHNFNLVIQDPFIPNNNISKGTFKMNELKKAFSGGFSLLTNKCYELHHISPKNRKGETILGHLMTYESLPRTFSDERHLIVNEALKDNEEYNQNLKQVELQEKIKIKNDKDNPKKLSKETSNQINPSINKKKTKTNKKLNQDQDLNQNDDHNLSKNENENENDDYDYDLNETIDEDQNPSKDSDSKSKLLHNRDSDNLLTEATNKRVKISDFH
ncbi:Nucleotidyltransferase, partial [Ascoidea rubescens DSM 1968]